MHIFFLNGGFCFSTLFLHPVVFCLFLAKPFWLSVSYETQDRGSLSWRCAELISRRAFGVGNVLDIFLHLHLCEPQFLMLQKVYPSHGSSIPWASWHMECVPRAGVAFYNHPSLAQAFGTSPALPRVVVPRSVVLGAVGCLRVSCLGRGACHLMIKPPPSLKQHFHDINSA